MRVLIDSYASDDVERFQYWHHAIPRVAHGLSDRGHDVFVCIDGSVSSETAEAISAVPRATVVNFPRRSDAFSTWATEANLLTRLSRFYNVDAVVTSGHSYVLGMPTLVVVANEIHGVIDSEVLEANLLLRLAVTMASAIVVPDVRAKTSVQSLLPALSPDFVSLAGAATYGTVIPTLLGTMDTRLDWFHTPEMSAIIEDYQRRARRLQT
jgi:hypothetical protein